MLLYPSPTKKTSCECIEKVAGGDCSVSSFETSLQIDMSSQRHRILFKWYCTRIIIYILNHDKHVFVRSQLKQGNHWGAIGSNIIDELIARREEKRASRFWSIVVTFWMDEGLLLCTISSMIPAFTSFAIVWWFIRGEKFCQTDLLRLHQPSRNVNF